MKGEVEMFLAGVLVVVYGISEVATFALLAVWFMAIAIWLNQNE